jgi:ribA/ribD-fused uncharacterized protein
MARTKKAPNINALNNQPTIVRGITGRHWNLPTTSNAHSIKEIKLWLCKQPDFKGLSRDNLVIAIHDYEHNSFTALPDDSLRPINVYELRLVFRLRGGGPKNSGANGGPDSTITDSHKTHTLASSKHAHDASVDNDGPNKRQCQLTRPQHSNPSEQMLLERGRTTITEEQIQRQWMLYPLVLTQQVIAFFGCKGQLGYLSNFFMFNHIQFTIPSWCSDGQHSPLYTVSSAEQMIMLMKAHLFKDTRTAAEIANAKSPSEAKSLGRRVQRFKEDTWNQYVCDIAYYALITKFGHEQNQLLRENLLNTGDAILAEATTYDKKWSIGTNPDDIRARHPHTFAGSNIQGYTLMEIRKTLRADSTTATLCARTQPYTGSAPNTRLVVDDPQPATPTEPGPSNSEFRNKSEKSPIAILTTHHARDDNESPEMITSDADSQAMEPDDDMQDSQSKIILELCPDADPGAITKSYNISPGALNKVTTNDLGETSHTYTAQATRPTEILLILGRTSLQQARSQQLFIPEFLHSWPDTEHENNALLLLDDSRPAFAKKAGCLHATIRITITDTSTTAEIRDCKRIIQGRPQSLPTAYRTRIIRPDHEQSHAATTHGHR